MNDIEEALQHLDRRMSERNQQGLISFEEFLRVLAANPAAVIRNVFQVLHDMILSYVGEGRDEYPDDPESIHYVSYDCSRLFVEGSDRPFFADRIFANRLVNLVEAMKSSSQQNKIYIFEGPSGCGKSTFLNNLLRQFEGYANTEEGSRFETVWKLDRKALGGRIEKEVMPLVQEGGRDSEGGEEKNSAPGPIGEQVIVPCPSHDHPILMIPKPDRRPLFDTLFRESEFKKKLFTAKEYDWVFRENPCTICSSLYDALLHKLNSPRQAFQMLYARLYRFNRRLGQGISVFNPGDKPMKETVFRNEMAQKKLDALLGDSNQVKYIYSKYAKTNNGIYALMDIKSYNVERMIELHNIISEGVHKVEDIEENVNSLLLGVMNPEDQKEIENVRSLLDRTEYINIPYVMDLNTEVEIYRTIFGRNIDQAFLPMILDNFARAIISSRLNRKSEALREWIGDPRKYHLYCDENLQLLKMEIYRGHIPEWLTEEDRKRFTADRRRKVIAESETEGQSGISGRDSIRLLNEFYSTYAREDRLINMSILQDFFNKSRKELKESIPEEFLDSLRRLYDYTVLQEVKESLYDYNEEQISKDIQNYLFAINFEPGDVETCKFTGEKLEIGEGFFEALENRILGSGENHDRHLSFRKETQKEYATQTLTQEMMVEGKKITETQLFRTIHELYVHSLKESVLAPFLQNTNFRRAIKDYGKEAFKTYDERIRRDVTFLMNHLREKYGYTAQGSKEVCIYVIDNDLAKKFTAP